MEPHEPWPEDDSRFVGVRDEVRRLLDGVAARLEGEVTSTQRKAAELFAETLDRDAVDAMLQLPAGTVRGWTKDDRFMKRAVSARASQEMYRPPEVDAGLALDPRQREAARLLAVEYLNQNETAAAVGVDRRTIYNWLRRPTFVSYLQQLEEEEQQHRRAVKEARMAPMLEDLDDLRAIVAKESKRRAAEGDPKVIGEVLRSLLTKH